VSQQLLPHDSWGSYWLRKRLARDIDISTRWSAGHAKPMTRSKGKPMNWKIWDGKGSEIVWLIKKPNSSVRRDSQVW
jgi:hypothetical protein